MYIRQKLFQIRNVFCNIVAEKDWSDQMASSEYEEAKIQTLRNRVRERISSLIFAEELCTQLQEHVESQVKN